MDQNQNNPYGNNPYGNNPYGNNPYGNQPYQNPYRNNPAENGFVTAAFVLSIISIGFAIIGLSFFAFIPASLAIIFAILSKGKSEQLPNKSRSAIILAIAGCIVACVMTIYVIYTIKTNPDMMRQFDTIMQQMYGMTFEEMMEQMKNGTFQYNL